MTNVQLLSLKVVKEKSARYDISKKINTPTDIVDFVSTILDMESFPEEHLIMLSLDTKNNIVGMFDVSHGSLNASVVHPREVYKRALLTNASSIIIIHNHPSGDPIASNEDKNLTTRLFEAGKILGITLLDHIVIGSRHNYVSLKEMGIL